MSNLQQILLEPAKAFLFQVGQFLGKALWVIIILIVGWIIARFIKALITKALRLVQIDAVSDKIELDSVLAKGGISYSLSELIGVMGYWVVVLVTAMVAINALGLTVAAELLQKLVLYVPNIIAAIFILILGMFVATILSNLVKAAANNAGLSQAKLLSKVVEVVVIIIAAAMTLEQLGIGAKTVELIIQIVLASLGLGCALAFGLGCKDIAGKSVADLVEKLRKK